MKFFLILLTGGLFTGSLHAQQAEDSVKWVVNRMFEGMKNADSGLVRSALADSVIFQTLVTQKDGSIRVASEDPREFVAFIGRLSRGDADEQITFETVRVDGPLAMAWTPYTFYYKGQFSHCGVDCFQLVRINGAWKIQYIIDTRRRQPCP
ncbi:MAG TPA: nuclear transport factor 2 family protein [Chitinophagaceae bacterium]|nr:nuclear transport factor 2 family protein [Chitinophagaceae bacterium]